MRKKPLRKTRHDHSRHNKDNCPLAASCHIETEKEILFNQGCKHYNHA